MEPGGAIKRTGLAVLLLGAAVLVWEAVSRFGGVPPYILPAPLAVGKSFLCHGGLLLNHTATTAAEIGLGLALALVLGLGAALAIHASCTLAGAVLPLLIASQAVPVFAVAPLLILWLGYGVWSKAAMAAIIVFFPLTINTVRGLEAADPDMTALLTIMGASNTRIFLTVRLPQSLPFVFAGLKIGASVSVIGAVIGEWVGADRGLGYLMMQANAQLRLDLLFAAILVLSAVGVLLYGLVVLAERLITPRGL